MNQKLHIISFDGLSKLDMDFLKTQPNFKRFLEGASYSFEVESVYPTLTYPAHTSISTGNYPNKHGIVNNTLVQPYRRRPDWYWHESYIKTKTFQQLATENGYSVLSLLWPVMGKAKIKYNMPEIFSNRVWSNQIMVSLKSGSKKFQIDLFKRFGSVLDGIKQPNLDTFTHNNYIYSLKNYKTDVTMVHYTDVDSTRHNFGFSSSEANKALIRHDKRLGEILDTIENLGDMENTTIAILGDHSSLDNEKVIFLNTVFYNLGFIKLKNGRIVKWDLYAKEAGGSCYIYSKNNISFEELRDILKDHIDFKGIEKIYSSKEAKELGADENCIMMLEGSRNYLFEDEIAPKAVMDIKELEGLDITYHTNNHGYSPHLKKDYETVFMIKGNKIKKGINIGKMNLVDEGPTFARILGLELKDVDGRVLEEILIGD